MIFLKKFLNRKKRAEDAIIDFSKEILKQKKENVVNEVFNVVLEKTKKMMMLLLNFLKRFLIEIRKW